MPKAMGRSAPKKSMATTKDPMPEYVCPHCGKTKKSSEFYVSTDPAVVIGVAFPCKNCAENIARRYDARTGDYADVTESSLKSALMYLDKPFVRTLWESAYNEVHNEGLKQPKKNMWTSYIKNVTSLPQYRGKRWRNGDFEDNNGGNPQDNSDEKNTSIMTPEALDAYKTNKKDVIRLIGYDPFANYPVKQDLPVLYAQLISFIDEETKNDGMKMNAIIQIVQAFNQIQKLNDAINELSADTQKLNTNNGTIKQHADTISKLLSGANALAKDNGIKTIVPA